MVFVTDIFVAAITVVFVALRLLLAFLMFMFLIWKEHNWGADYMGSFQPAWAEFQPGLNFNPGWISTRLTKLKFVSRLHGKFQPGMSYRMSVQTGAKSQPGLKRSSSKMELFRFFEEFKMWFMSIFDFCKTVVIHLKIEQTEIKPRCFFNPGWNVPSIIQDDFQPVNRDDIFWARVAWTTTRAETHPGLKFLSCNRLLHVF